MIRTYLDWLLGVPWGERSDERLDPVAAREVLDADHAGLEDVKDRITEYIAVRGLRRERGLVDEGRGAGAILTLIGPPGHRQDLDRRVDRPRDRARVRAHVAGRRPRRGRDPRPPPHLHRRPAGPPRPRAQGREDDEPGDHARRGRQGRRRLARRPELGPARGPRPGAEPLLPRPLPRRRARPLRGPVHRHGERRRDDPGPAARPHGGRALRRLHDRREGRDRPRLPVAAPARAQRPARRRGRDRRRACSTAIVTEYTREAGVRGLERELGKLLRKTATRIASGEAEAPVAIDADAVREALGRQRFFQEAAERTAVPGRRDRPLGHRRRRRRAVHRDDLDARQGGLRAHRPARRRDEGVGADRALLRARPRRASSGSTTTRSPSASSTSTSPPGRSPRTARAPGSR